MMEVARALSFQKPGLSESCLSFWILSRRLSTSKKPPYPGNAGPHIIQFFDCHSGANIVESCQLKVEGYCEPNGIATIKLSLRRTLLRQQFYSAKIKLVRMFRRNI